MAPSSNHLRQSKVNELPDPLQEKSWQKRKVLKMHRDDMEKDRTEEEDSKTRVLIGKEELLCGRVKQQLAGNSFIVTSLHHRPWGAGDNHATIGVFSTEKEAEDAAYKDFLQRCERYANGWESEWRRRPGNDTRQLYGYCEDREKDSEEYTASIKRVQQKRQVTVQPRVLSTAQLKPGVVKPRHVYVVKKEQWINVGKDDPQGFCDEVGELKAVEIHGIYVDLDAANDSTRRIYHGIVEDIDGAADTVTDTLKNSMATILVTDYEKLMTWSISVEKKSVQ
ncbi:MAG: hypothetical protein ASARMPREDX12_000967 [Alectoria sarmentosa]|nr:MAG: hypothetical protein ASARMPREDX12_000967 [Alectoria sarmentosa]